MGMMVHAAREALKTENLRWLWERATPGATAQWARLRYQLETIVTSTQERYEDIWTEEFQRDSKARQQARDPG